LKKLSSAILLTILSSCSSYIPKSQVENSAQVKSKETSIPKVIVREVVKIKRVVSSFDDPTFDPIHDLDLDYKQKHYNFWVKYFSKKEKARFLRHAKNGAKYKTVVHQILESHGLPKDLFYVGLIESGYNTYIRSRAKAVGPWQFIKGTATRYGLRVDSYTDERSHIIKSTEAAASYFKDLYNIFGSWELALCAYNAGEYRIINAIRKGNTRDYKELVAKKLIPKETIFYIPKVAAARALYENPGKYGLNLPKIKPSIFEKVKPVKVAKSFDMYNLAKKHNVSLKTFKILNPDLRRRWVRVSKWRKQQVFLPSTYTTDFRELAHSSFPREGNRSLKNVSHQTYKVKRGDNLSIIARRLGVRVSDLRRLNKIRGSKIYVGQSLKVRKVASSNPSYTTSVHKVKRGENLYLIGRRYGLSVRELKKLNSLRSSKIRVGQKLKVKSTSISRYKVRRGDNLTKIASRFGIAISDIKNHNNLRSSKIRVGQRLIIPNKG
jgi:membrane-bound lytic murein transglycosylase D